VNLECSYRWNSEQACVLAIQTILCNNGACAKPIRVLVDGTESIPILFCSNECLNSFLLQSEKNNPDLNSEDPNEVKEFVNNLMNQVDIIQQDFKRLRNLRMSYFDIFTGGKLKDENYKRKWSFRRKQE